MGQKKIKSNDTSMYKNANLQDFDFGVIDIALSREWLASKNIESEHTTRRLIARCREEIVNTNPPKMRAKLQIMYVRTSFERLLAELKNPEKALVIKDENEVARICIEVLEKSKSEKAAFCRYLSVYQIPDAELEVESLGHMAAARVVNSFHKNRDRKWTKKYIENTTIAALRNAVRDMKNEVLAIKRGNQRLENKNEVRGDDILFASSKGLAEIEYQKSDLVTKIENQIAECTNHIVEARIQDHDEKQIYRSVIESTRKLLLGEFSGRSCREIEVLGNNFRSVTKKSPPLFLLTKLVLEYLDVINEKSEMKTRNFAQLLDLAKNNPVFADEPSSPPKPLFTYKQANGKIKGTVTVFIDSKMKKTFACIAPSIDEAKKSLVKLMEAA